MKTLYTMKELCEMTQVTKRSLYYYEDQGLLEPQRNTQNYRIYTAKDCMQLKCILLCRDMGLTIEEIKALYHEDNKYDTLQQLLKEKKKEIKKEVDDIRKQMYQIQDIRAAYLDDHIHNMIDLQELQQIKKSNYAKSYYVIQWIEKITFTRVMIAFFLCMDLLIIVAFVLSFLFD